MHIIEKSLEIALKAYSGQKDKAGEPYILHPLRVMMRMATHEEMAAALLHDVVEDSEIGPKELSEEGIPTNVVEAVASLSKQEGESYDDFIDRILPNRLAAKVKKADIEDNINVLRLDVLKAKDLERVAKYHKAWMRLGSVN